MGIRTGVWRTAGGSTLKLKVENGRISGQYSTVHGQPTPGKEFPIVGMVNGDLIGFICSWNEHQSLTSWCGRYGVEDGRECIFTAWHLARIYADRAHQQKNEPWETFTSNTNTYFLVSENVAP